MKPGSFDQETAREMVGDERARVIEAKARVDADEGNYSPPEQPAARTYMDGVNAGMERVVYRTQFNKRVERNKRKAAK